MGTITKAALRKAIQTDLKWIADHDANLAASWRVVEEDYPEDLEFEVLRSGDETIYLSREADFAIAIYGQSEPRFATWLHE